MDDIVKYESAKKEIADCKLPQEAGSIQNKAKAWKEVLKRAGASKIDVKRAGEINLLAGRQAGILITSLDFKKNKGAAEKDWKKTRLEGITSFPTYAEQGITKEQAFRWKQLKEIRENSFDQYIDSAYKNTLDDITESGVISYEKNLLREEAYNKIKKKVMNPPDIDKDDFRIIYADPPWDYSDRRDPKSKDYREFYYPSMSIDEICELKIGKNKKRFIKDIPTKNAVLFLWVTTTILEDSFKVVNAWGFKYKTTFIWDKVRHNMGHYNSVRHEILFVCTKGSCTPDINNLFDSVVTIDRSDFPSQKPDYFRSDIIDKLYPYGFGIDLFSRKKKGELPTRWAIWGNQIE